MPKNWKFELGEQVKITVSGEVGNVIARFESIDGNDEFRVRYKDATGRALEYWWAASALSPMADAKVAAEEPLHGPVPSATAREIHSVTDSSPADQDGMPYDPAIHSDPPSLTDKGFWRVRKGRAAEAEAARAQWKARGAGIVAPVAVLPPAAPVAVLPPAAPVGLPGMTVAAPILPTPVSIEDLMSAAARAANSGKIDSTTFANLYAKHGVTHMQMLETNESLRRALFDDIVALEGAAT